MARLLVADHESRGNGIEGCRRVYGSIFPGRGFHGTDCTIGNGCASSMAADTTLISSGISSTRKLFRVNIYLTKVDKRARIEAWNENLPAFRTP